MGFPLNIPIKHSHVNHNQFNIASSAVSLMKMPSVPRLIVDVRHDADFVVAASSFTATPLSVVLIPI